MTSTTLSYPGSRENSRPATSTGAHGTQQIPAWVLLAAGTVLLPLAALKWNLAPLAWFAPVPFLLFLRQSSINWRHRVVLLLALMAATNLMTLKLVTDPVPWMIAPAYGVPIALALWCVYVAWAGIRSAAGDRWALYSFPALMALLETASHRLTEFGVWGAAANTQLGDLRLLQFASLFGVAGIGFLMAWTASLIALLLATRDLRRFRLDIAALLLTLAAVYAYGSLRLFTEQSGESVRVAGIVANLGPTPTGLPDAGAIARNTEELFARSEIAAQRGARVVVWNEAATVVEASEESLFVARGKELAKRRQVDIVLAYIVPVANANHMMENKYVWVAENGGILETYYKHHPVPGEGSLRGEAPLRLIERPYARAAGAICYDYDFPEMAQVHSRLGAGLVFVPSSDWRGIDPYHTQMASVRAIEGGFSILRPVRWATSGAFDAYGRPRATMSHFEENDRIIEATLPTTPVRTLYAQIGDSAAVGYALVLVGALVSVARRRMTSRDARRAFRTLAIVAFIAMSGCGHATVAPTDPNPTPNPNPNPNPGPVQEPRLGGSMYVLQRVADGEAPFLTSDHVYASDATRIRFWILADTIRFAEDNTVKRKRAHRQLDETPGHPDTSDEWISHSSGGFEQSNGVVRIAWGLTAMPVPVPGRDTLFVRPEGLVMRVKHAGSCYNCEDGPTVEYLYVRR